MRVKAIIFDLFKTLGEFESYITDEQVSDILINRGYPIYPQTWKHAFHFVIFIDYPKHGYPTYKSLLQQVFNRLETEIDQDTLAKVISLFMNSRFKLYEEGIAAVKLAKEKGFKIAICTTTPKPFFIDEITPIIKDIDYICTGYEARTEKSNPNIYQTVLRNLQTTPKETVVIGDNPQLDINNAKKLGFHTIQIIQEGRPSPQADLISTNAYEAVKLLD